MLGEKVAVPKLLLEIQMMEDELKKQANVTGLTDESQPDVAKNIAKMTKQLGELKLKRTRQLQARGKAKHRLEGERPTKYWTNLHKDCKPRELIRAFKDETETTNDARPVFVSESHKMADMAKQYHMALQDERDPTGDAEQRERSIQTALRAVQMTISAEQAEAMGRDYTYQGFVNSSKC